MVPGQSNALTGIASGAADDILVGTIVLNEIEVYGCKVAQRMSEISYQANGLKKDLRQDHRRAAVQIDASIIQVTNDRRKQAKIMEAALSQKAPVRCRMRVSRVCSERHNVPCQIVILCILLV